MTLRAEPKLSYNADLSQLTSRNNQVGSCLLRRENLYCRMVDVELVMSTWLWKYKGGKVQDELWLNDALADGVADQPGRVVDIEPFHDLHAMRFCSFHADTKNRCYLFGSSPLSY